MRAVVPLLPYDLSWDLAPDATVLAFTGAVTLVVTLLFGVAPSVRLSRTDPGPTLRRTARVTGGNGLRNLLVVGQVAGALVLVVGAGLFARSIVAAQSVAAGSSPKIASQCSQRSPFTATTTSAGSRS